MRRLISLPELGPLAFLFAMVVIITACSSGTGSDSSVSGGLTGDPAIYLANQSPEERACLQDTYSDSAFAQALQAWADFVTDEAAERASIAETADLWACGRDEFSTIRAMARSILPSLPETAAPAGLSGSAVPVDLDSAKQLLERMPESLDGMSRTGSTDGEIIYRDSTENRALRLTVGDFLDPDYQGEWQASDGIISRHLSRQFDLAQIGVDGNLLWTRFSIAESSTRTIHAINWGVIDAPIWFQTAGLSAGDVDLITRELARVAAE